MINGNIDEFVQKLLDAFLKEPLFDGKTFWECEKEWNG